MSRSRLSSLRSPNHAASTARFGSLSSLASVPYVCGPWDGAFQASSYDARLNRHHILFLPACGLVFTAGFPRGTHPGLSN
eukprot:scaffold2319_cov350-Pavlova_lutheri.AAC.3